MHVYGYRYTTGAPRYGAPSSLRDRYPTQLRRGSDRPIGPIQMNGDSVFIPDPARLWSISNASCPSKRAADRRNRTMTDCLPSISNACPPFTKQHPDQQQNSVPRPDLASSNHRRAKQHPFAQIQRPMPTFNRSSNLLRPSSPMATPFRTQHQQNPDLMINSCSPTQPRDPARYTLLNPFEHGRQMRLQAHTNRTSTAIKSCHSKPICPFIAEPLRGRSAMDRRAIDRHFWPLISMQIPTDAASAGHLQRTTVSDAQAMGHAMRKAVSSSIRIPLYPRLRIPNHTQRDEPPLKSPLRKRRKFQPSMGDPSRILVKLND
ncbi:hypothetical protein ACLOJK_019313 [Asimina triloba]